MFRFDLVNEILEDFVKLEKLPIILTDISLGDYDNLKLDEIIFYSQYINVRDIQTYDVELLSSGARKKTITGTVECYNDVLYAFARLIKEGKLLLLYEIIEESLSVSLVLTDIAFTNTYPDDITNLHRDAFKGNPIKSIFQFLFPLNDDKIQYDASETVIKKGIQDLYSYIRNLRRTRLSGKIIDDQRKIEEMNIENDELLDQVNSIISTYEIENNLKNTGCNSLCINEISEKRSAEYSTETNHTYQHKSLIPELRPYQFEAVEWMIFKERNDCFETEKYAIHSLWQEIRCTDGKTIYINPYTGKLSKERFTQTPLPKGGILAEEMGLGKTVEVLACILNHQCPTKFQLELDDEKGAQSPKKSNTLPTVLTEKRKSDNITSEKIMETFTMNNLDRSTSIKENETLTSKQAIEDLNKENKNCVINYLPHSGLISTFKDDHSMAEPMKENYNKKSKSDERDLEYTIKKVIMKKLDTAISDNETLTLKQPMENSSFNDLCEIPDIIENQIAGNKNKFSRVYFHDSDNETNPLKDGHAIAEPMIENNCKKRKSDENSLEHTIKKIILSNLDAAINDNEILALKKAKEDSSLNDWYEMPVIQNQDTSNEDSLSRTVSNDSDNANSPKKFSPSSDFISPLKDVYVMSTANVLFTCFICGDNQKIKDTKVKCISCNNVMHKICAGYQLLNVKQHECPDCAMKQMIDTHCTLIVCPDTLLPQWVEEIQKHIRKDSLKFMVYQGLKNFTFIQPKLLADYDIIITAFSTLRMDFNYVQSVNSTRVLRHQKKYAALPCPLLAINFWRLCIDEAQMVESDSTKLAEMALRIPAIHRWCITGTPLQKSLEDIYGLLFFLMVHPYNTKLWWKRAMLDHMMYGNYDPLFNLTSKIMWRTMKTDVENQIHLPKQTEYVSLLNFSAVEQHFYHKEQTRCFQRMKEQLDKYYIGMDNTSLSELNKNSLTSLLGPMLSLRQACCHPAVVKNSYLSLGKSCVTMEELCSKLMKNAKLEAEDAQRKLVRAINGLAGLAILEKNYQEAKRLYCDVVSTWEKYEQLRPDKLQKLHLYTNLHVVATSLDENKDTKDMYISKANEIREKYLSNVINVVLQNENEFNEVKNKVIKIEKDIDKGNPWWVAFLNHPFVRVNNQKDLVQKINDELSSFFSSSSATIRGKFRNVQGLQFILCCKMDQLKEMRENAIEGLKMISIYPSAESVAESAECCLRPVEGQEVSRCIYCCTDNVIRDYEKVIFAQRGYIDSENTNSNATGLRSQTELDIVMKVIVSCCKTYGIRKEITDQGVIFNNYLEAIKKEFKYIRSLSSAYHQRVQALDELEMCTMRLRFQYDQEEISEKNQNFVIRKGELNMQRLTYVSDKKVAELELRGKLSQLMYLDRISKVQTENEGYNPETCPVCCNAFGTEWAVFQCGHCLCCECVSRFQRQSLVCVKYMRQSEVQIKCPMCRSVTHTRDISFVVTKAKEPEGFDAHLTLKGQYSTKIGAILRRVRWIREQDERNKVLIFSTWITVLRLIANALTENELVYKILDGNKKKFQECLSIFKESNECNILLMPLSSGAKGLNIIEATHVILAEPALNPGDELQAVGRVHRIGQTKPTFVHRFIIKGTIEEKLHELFQSRNKEKNERESTTNLTVGDLNNLIS